MPKTTHSGLQMLLTFLALVFIFFALFGFDFEKAYQFLIKGNLDIFRSLFN